MTRPNKIKRPGQKNNDILRPFDSYSKLSRWPAKSSLYQGRKPTSGELDMRDEGRPLIVIDDAYSSTKGEKILIAARVPKDQRKNFRSVSDKFNKPIKDGHEKKYSNTEASERDQIYRCLSNVQFEITDTFDLKVPKDFEKKIPIRFEGKINEQGRKYVYQTYLIIKEIIRRHPESVDIVMDNPPYEIYDELMRLCNLLISEGYRISWYVITPSGTLNELWVADYVAGLDRDVLDNHVEDNPKMKVRDSNGKETIPESLRDSIERMKGKRKMADYEDLGPTISKPTTPENRKSDVGKRKNNQSKKRK